MFTVHEESNCYIKKGLRNLQVALFNPILAGLFRASWNRGGGGFGGLTPYTANGMATNFTQNDVLISSNIQAWFVCRRDVI